MRTGPETPKQPPGETEAERAAARWLDLWEEMLSRRALDPQAFAGPSGPSDADRAAQA